MYIYYLFSVVLCTQQGRNVGCVCLDYTEASSISLKRQNGGAVVMVIGLRLYFPVLSKADLICWRFVCFFGQLLNVSATCKYISGTDLLRQFYVLQL